MKPQRTGFAAMVVAGALALSAPLRVAAQGDIPFAADSLHVPRVRYVPLANLDGFRLPPGEPWSPTAPQLLLVNRGALYIVDATDSTFTPRLLLESQVLDVRWSPDGSYVACRIRVPTAIRGGSVRLQFVEAAGGPSETRAPRGRIGTTVWADDGMLYFWDTRTGIRKRLQAPLSWRNRHPSLPLARRVHLLQIPKSGKRRPRVIAFTPAPQPHEQVVTALMRPQATQVSIVDDIPGTMSTEDARFLVQMQPRGGSLRTFVVDSKGKPLARLGETEGSAFIGTSVSSDGRFVIGHRARGGAGMLMNSEVWLADAAGKWSTPVENAPSSVAARFSSVDLVLAHEDPSGETVRLGRLEIEMP